MLPTYRLDHPENDESLVLDGWSYVWGSLTGPFYVLSKRLYGLAAIMLVITLALCGGTVVGLTLAVFMFDASIPGLALMLVIVLVAFVLNGVAAVELVRYGFLRQGWRIGY